MKKIIPFLLIITIILITSCAPKKPWNEQQIVLGTTVSITIHDNGSYKDYKGKVSEIFAEMMELHNIWANAGESSDLALLAENAGGKSQPINEYTFDLLAKGLRMEKLTDDAFNLKMGPVTELWGFCSDNPHLPDSSAISAALTLVDGGMYFAGKNCLLGLPGMKLDVGGIGKGFAVDMAVEELKSCGVKSGIVDAGGDLRTFGTPKHGGKWKIGIRHPRQAGKFYGTLSLTECAVATSGDYQQFFEVEGKRYHHIIDPATGYPAAAECVSATVVTKNCLEADAAATALMVMTPDKAMMWLGEHPEYMGIIIYFDQDGNLIHKISSALESSFEKIFTTE